MAAWDQFKALTGALGIHQFEAGVNFVDLYDTPAEGTLTDSTFRQFTEQHDILDRAGQPGSQAGFIPDSPGRSPRSTAGTYLSGLAERVDAVHPDEDDDQYIAIRANSWPTTSRRTVCLDADHWVEVSRTTFDL